MTKQNVPPIPQPGRGRPPVLLPVSLLRGWQRRFVHRPEPYALQQQDGTYRWHYEPWGLHLLVAHLTGELTLALSSTDPHGKCKWLCLDVDATQEDSFAKLLALRTALADYRWPGLVEASRRGGHLWFLLDRSVPALEARSVLLDTLAQCSPAIGDLPAYELYPDTTKAGTLGHAVRLPLGVHQLTGKRYPLFDAEGLPCAFTILRTAMRFVLNQPRVSVPLIRERYRELAQAPIADDAAPSSSRAATRRGGRGGLERFKRVGTSSSVIRWVDARVSPLDLLAELAPDTELHKAGQGYIGWCPFHDDRAADEAGKPGTPSFYVVHDRHYGWSWRCFSTNCQQSVGPLRHSFRLFQELEELSVKRAIIAAYRRWPQAESGRRQHEGEASLREEEDNATQNAAGE
jgi:hypothetical protein